MADAKASQGALDPVAWLRYLLGCKYSSQDAMEVIRLIGSAEGAELSTPDALKTATASDLNFLPKKLAGKLLKKAGLTSSRRKRSGGEGALSPAKKKKVTSEAPGKPASSEKSEEELGSLVVSCKRTPVMILLGAVAAEKMFGLSWAEALSAGKAVADAYAQMKAQHIGLTPWERDGGGTASEGASRVIRLLDIDLEVTGGGGVLFRGSTEEVNSARVATYLSKAFGDDMPVVLRAMEILVGALEESDMKEDRFLYGIWERIRPAVPRGKAGWGYKGNLSLGAILEEKATYLSHKESLEDQKLPAESKQ